MTMATSILPGPTVFQSLAQIRASIDQARLGSNALQIAMRADPPPDPDVDRDLLIQLKFASELLEQAADYVTPEAFNTDRGLAGAGEVSHE
jgi:hypothetical protein